MKNPLENWKPRYRRTKVEMSPLKDEIEKRLETESPAKVAEWLRAEGESISARSLRSYRNKIIGAKKALYHGNFYQRYKILANEKIDALEELYTAAQVQMKRLSIGLQVEQTKNTMLSTVDKGIDLLRRIYLDILSMEMDLGIRERISSGEPPKGMSDIYLKDLLEKVISANRNSTLSENDSNDDDSTLKTV